MPEIVVDQLEMVDVDHDRTDEISSPAGPGKLAPQVGDDLLVVPKSSERIMGRLDPERFTCRDQLIVQVDNPPAGAQARPQLIDPKRLGEVVVRTGIHAGAEVFLAA